MQHVFRALSCSLLALCAAFFSIIFYGISTIPDSFCVAQEELPQVELPFIATLVGTGDSPILMESAAAQTEDGDAANAALQTVQRAGAYEYDLNISVLKLFPVKTARVTVARRRYVVPGGQVFGIKLYTKGVVVVGIDSVTTAEGSQNPAAKAGLKEGDLILEVDGRAIERNREIAGLIEKSNGKELSFTVERDGKRLQILFTPVKASDGNYRAGIWVRDSSAGIGTLTFFDAKTGIFAGLGHAVCDVDTGETMPISGGDAVEANIKGCYKGTGGKPGELCGVFSNRVIGSLLTNCATGIYGRFEPDNVSQKPMPVALRHEVREGPAQLLTTVDGTEARLYDIEITKVYANEETHKKHLIVKVTDEALIEQTGGIVQGMSGSPILQNGMLVGAVTHVFVNNPLQGYGIFAQTMLETVDALLEEEYQKAA